MKFITLSVSLAQSTFNEAQDGTITSQCIGWFGVEGNPYTKQNEDGQWTGFVEGKRIDFSAKTKDIDIIKQAALAACEEYRINNYPDT